MFNLSLSLFFLWWAALSGSGVELKPIQVLFVGNSLTYTNDLPVLVQAEAAEKHIVIQATMLALPNYSLEDHWNDGKLQAMIESEQYDYIVVQQGPSSQADGRDMLLNYGKKISDLCHQHRCRLVFFMVWPAINNYQTFTGVIGNYSHAAAETNSILCAVGEAWKQYIDQLGDYSYYSSDGFHPSLKGSKEAARIISSVILQQ